MNGQLEISKNSYCNGVRRIADDFPTTEKNTLEFFAAARAGNLRGYLADNPETGYAVLYQVVSDLVYERLTRAFERTRGHRTCLISAAHLEPDCHDRFQDDVIAVRDYLLRNIDQPFDNLRGWLVSRLKPVTIDAHRARRGLVGATQRPRLPRWLGETLDSDAWLCSLAVGMLTWAGIPTAAPNGLWPLGAWAERRTEATGSPYTEAQVERDVERVRKAMHARAGWYERYVETPLGFKRAPLAALRGSERESSTGDGGSREPLPLSLTEPDQCLEAWLHEAAAEAIAAVTARVGAGQPLRPVLISVLSELFAAGTGAYEMDCAPDTAPDIAAQVVRRLADPETVERIADALAEIIEGAPRPSGTARKAAARLSTAA